MKRRTLTETEREDILRALHFIAADSTKEATKLVAADPYRYVAAIDAYNSHAARCLALEGELDAATEITVELWLTDGVFRPSTSMARTAPNLAAWDGYSKNARGMKTLATRSFSKRGSRCTSRRPRQRSPTITARCDAMAFMELFTEYGSWYVVDGTVIPADVVNDSVMTVLARLTDAWQGRDAETGYFDVPACLQPYLESTRMREYEVEDGWCARYSAPGYLDCTDWCGPYSTEEEAIEECRAVYGSDEDDESGEETAP